MNNHVVLDTEDVLMAVAFGKPMTFALTVRKEADGYSMLFNGHYLKGETLKEVALELRSYLIAFCDQLDAIYQHPERVKSTDPLGQVKPRKEAQSENSRSTKSTLTKGNGNHARQSR